MWKSHFFCKNGILLLFLSRFANANTCCSVWNTCIMYVVKARMRNSSHCSQYSLDTYNLQLFKAPLLLIGEGKNDQGFIISIIISFCMYSLSARLAFCLLYTRFNLGCFSFFSVWRFLACFLLKQKVEIILKHELFLVFIQRFWECLDIWIFLMWWLDGKLNRGTINDYDRQCCAQLYQQNSVCSVYNIISVSLNT